MRKKTEKQNKKELIAQGSLLPAKVISLTRGELVEVKRKEFIEGKITVYEFGQELKLKDEEIKFVEVYTSNEHFGDRREAAMIAYNISPQDPACKKRADAIGARIGKHQGVITLINAVLPSIGYSVEDAQLALGFLVRQHSDLKMKGVAAKIIMETEGKLKKDQTLTIKHQFDYSAISTEELLKMKEIMNKAASNTIDIPHEEI